MPLTNKERSLGGLPFSTGIREMLLSPDHLACCKISHTEAVSQRLCVLSVSLGIVNLSQSIEAYWSGYTISYLDD